MQGGGGAPSVCAIGGVSEGPQSAIDLGVIRAPTGMLPLGQSCRFAGAARAHAKNSEHGCARCGCIGVERGVHLGHWGAVLVW